MDGTEIMKTLYLLRHAKAEPGNAVLSDEQRPLAARGREACDVIGRYMRERGYLPGQALCSPALRTRETLERVQKAYGAMFPASFDKKLYLAPPGEMLSRIQQGGGDISSLLVVGHNPGMHHLAALLVGGDHTRLWEKLELKYPTGTLSVLRFPVDSWASVSPMGGTLLDFVTPGELLEGE